MNHTAGNLLLAAACVGLFVNSSAAQAPYLEISTMKVHAGRTTEYLKLEHEIWKPLHQERVNEGKMVSWQLWEVVYPQGSHSDFDYVTVEVFDSWNKIDPNAEQDYQSLVTKVHPKLNIDQFVNMTEATREMTRVEILGTVDSAGTFPSEPGKEWVHLAFLRSQPTMGDDIEKVLHDSKRTNEERIRGKKLVGWAVYHVAIPGPGEEQYNYVEASAFPNFGRMEQALSGIDIPLRATVVGSVMLRLIDITTLKQ